MENKDNEVIILSGTAKGADSLGEQYAEEYQLKVERYPADWDTYGNKAGYLRNAKMAEVADYCVLFWDGVSKGTKSMKELAEKKGIPTKVVYY